MPAIAFRSTGSSIPTESIEIYLLEDDVFRLAATLQGKTPMFAPPFAELEIADTRRISLRGSHAKQSGKYSFRQFSFALV
jgi:hypothetical protein